jgi:DNA damage-binding protein 1
LERVHAAAADLCGRYRSPANARGRSDAHPEARGFLDGDFLELFLTTAPGSADARAILEGANEAERLELDDSQIRDILEGLQSVH